MHSHWQFLCLCLRCFDANGWVTDGNGILSASKPPGMAVNVSELGIGRHCILWSTPICLQQKEMYEVFHPVPRGRSGWTTGGGEWRGLAPIYMENCLWNGVRVLVFWQLLCYGEDFDQISFIRNTVTWVCAFQSSAVLLTNLYFWCC